MSGLRVAKDGHLARLNGAYAKEKLDFLDRFLPPALNVLARKPARWYVDLFSGPGRNVDAETGEEFASAAIRALSARGQGAPARGFTHAALVNIDPVERAALCARITELGSTNGVECIEHVDGDARVQGVSRLARIRRETPYAYAFVFADPENTSQMPWSTIQAIGERAPLSTDMYLLVPLDMDVNRQIATERAKRGPTVGALTKFFGHDSHWERIVDECTTDAQRSQMRAALLEHYCARLSAYWKFVIPVREVRRGNNRLYRMVFCTRDKVAAGIVASWEQRTHAPAGQIAMDFRAA